MRHASAFAPFANRVRTRRALLSSSAALLLAGMLPAAAHADGNPLPTGGSVASGSAVIGGTSGAMTVTQSSERAILNWQSFSVGQGNSITFVQPNAKSATLNRVTGTTGSEIAGAINSNGAVYLINPNGIAITKTGTVQTGGGFIASTLDIADKDFNAGTLAFTGKGASAAVSNAGRITAGQGAYVALLGGSVSNSGTISVPLGSVGLGSGEQIGLDINGDHFMQVAMPTSAVTGDGKALVDMAGTITVAGGRVTLSAATVKNAVRNIVNLTGTISADSAVGNGGTIVLLGGDGGTVSATGTLTARATGASGNGGSVETSGATVNFAGLKVDTTAAHGSTGNWLVDPTDLTVDAAAATTISANLATSNVTLSTDGNGGTSGPGVTSDGQGDINIAAALTWGSNSTLTLSAYHYININAPITAPKGGLSLTANNGGYQPGDIISASAPIDIGTFTLNSGNWVQNAASLPGFSAANFVINNPYGNSFLRATGGDGSSVSPYLIADVYGLQGLESYSLSGMDYVLANDIDASGTANWNGGAGFTPIGSNQPFTGDFDGKGHAISGLTILTPTLDNVALFAVDHGDISNVALVGGTISGRSSTAGLLGSQFSGSTVSNSSSSATIISSAGNSGGLVGYANGAIVNSSASGSVGGAGDSVGGLVGTLGVGASISGSHASGAVDVIGRTSGIGGLVGSSFGSIDSSYATGNVSGSNGASQVGGLVGVTCSHANGCSGDNAALATITNSYATGNVSADNGTVGGLVGLAYNATITGSYAKGKVLDTGNNQSFGGLVGATNGGVTLMNVHATGDVSGGGDVGGLVGTGTGVTISQAYATGNVSASVEYGGNTAYGGLVARLDQTGSITQSYATGSVTHAYTGNAYGSSVGGLVGAASGWITYSWASGAVSGTDDTVGGLIGTENNQSGVADTNNFATGNVTGNTLPDAYFTGTSIGGLIGAVNGNETIDASYATGTVSATVHTGGSYAGGLIGRVSFVNLILTRSYALGSVSVTGAVSTPDDKNYMVNTVSNKVGGLIGENDSNGLIDQVYASGAVVADGQSSDIGGLIGRNRTGDGSAVISNSYATGAVLGKDPNLRYSPGSGDYYGDAYKLGGQAIGGLIGDMYSGTIVSTYSTGGVNGAANSPTIGGLIGYMENCAPNCGVSNSYWDTQASGIDTTAAGIGLTTNQMQGLAFLDGTYSGWNFETIWAPPSAGYYPQLYASTPVVYATAHDATTTYGTAPSSLGSYTGGPSLYVFGPAGDTLTGFLAGSTTATVNSNAGTYAITPYGGATFTSTGGVVYRVVADGHGTLTINPAPITIVDISASLTGSITKSYDGTTIATLAPGNFVLSGFVNGDGATVNQTVGTYASANAGTGILVTASLSANNFVANAGTNLSNYTLPTSASGKIGTITPATLTLMYAADSMSRIYGNANPLLTGTYSASGLVGNDTLAGVTSGSATFTSSAGATSNVGTYAVTGSGITSASGNYTIVATQAAGNATALTVTPRTVSVTADNATSVYGSSVPALAYTVGATTGDTGLVNDDTLSGALATAGSATSNAGTYAITQGTLGNGNYTLAFTGATLTINPAVLTLLYSADTLTRIYGNANPALTGTVKASGLVNGDTLAGVTSGSAGFTTNAGVTSGVGAYAVTGGGITSASGNYTIVATQAAGNASALTVTPRSVSVTANDATSVYGSALPVLTYVVGAGGANTGLVNGDTLSGALATSGSASANVGQYAITQGTLGNGNYTLAFTGATLAITPAALQIVYTATPTSSIYGNAVTVGGTANATGLVNGDTLAAVTSGSAMFTTTANAQSNVGHYAITGSGLALISQNYTVTFAQAPGNATALVITPRPITVTADPQQRSILTANPPLTYTVGGSGLVNGDTLSGKLATSAQILSGTGLYSITQGTLAASSNYALTFVGADLKVSAPPTQSLSDFLGWLREVLVTFHVRNAYCKPGSLSVRLRERTVMPHQAGMTV